MIPDIDRRRRDLEVLCHRFRVRRLELFGSAANGAFRPESSDLDFLVEFEAPAGPGYANRYFGLLEALVQMFGRPIDLVVEAAITNPYLRASIEQSRTLLYAA